MHKTIAAMLACGAIAAAGPAMAKAHVVEGVLPVGADGTVQLTSSWVAYYSGSFEFTGADLVSVEMSAVSGRRFNPPGPNNIYTFVTSDSCSAVVGGACNYLLPSQTGQLRNVAADGFDFVTADTLLLYAATSGPKPMPPGGFKWIGPDVVTTFDFTFAPHDGATEITYRAAFRANTIPEPTTWALLVGGFGLAGGQLRKRRTLAVLRPPSLGALSLRSDLTERPRLLRAPG